MGLKNVINGDTFDTTVIRREKTSNGFKNVKDKAAEIEDPDTGETLLKMKSDGLKIPKPDNQQFGTLWYKDFVDRITRSKSHTDFIEVYLKETGKDADGDYIQFNPEEDSEDLELAGSEAQFQTHRDLEAEKTLDIFSDDSNEEWYFLAGLGIITIVQLGGMWIVTNGMQDAIITGVKQGFSTVQDTANNAGSATGLIPVFGFMGRQKVSSLVASLNKKLKGVQ